MANDDSFLAQLDELGIDPVHLNALIKEAPFGVYLDHPTHGAVFANQTLLSTFRLSWEEFAGFGWASVVADADRDRLTQQIEEYERTHGTIDVQYRIIHENDEERWVHAFVQAVLNDAGEHIASLGVVNDVTENRALRKEHAMRQRLESVGQFAARVAHDFNNSLAAMLILSEELESEISSARGQENVTMLQDAIEQAAQVTGQLLALSRQRGQQMGLCKPDAEIVKLASLLEKTLGERITLDVQSGAPDAWVPMERGQVSQIVMNLATNARDAMESNGKITIRTSSNESRWVLTVTDHGCGIHPDQLQQVFTPFFTTKGLGRGTGLGLAIVNDIATLSGGKVLVESELDRGTTVTLTLPTVAPVTSAVQRRRSVQTTGPANLLLVEDNDALRQALGYALAMQGHAVRAARNLAEARDHFFRSDQMFEIVITDALLPDGNGFDFAAEIRADYPKFPIIITSGFSGDHDQLPTLDVEFFRFLAKPFMHGDLLDSIASLIGSDE